jgi:hypothetical protein
MLRISTARTTFNDQRNVASVILNGALGVKEPWAALRQTLFLSSGVREAKHSAQPAMTNNGRNRQAVLDTTSRQP